LSLAVKKQLEVIEKYIIQGNFKKASKLVATVIKSKDLDDENRLSNLVLQSEILNKQGKFQDALKATDNILNEKIVNNYTLLKLDVTIQKSEALMRINNFKQHKSTYEEGEKLILSLTELQPKIIAKRNALICALKAWIPFFIGEFEKSLEFSQKGLALHSNCIVLVGITYFLKNLSMLKITSKRDLL